VVGSAPVARPFLSMDDVYFGRACVGYSGLRILHTPVTRPSHATSAARYLEECLPRAEYWDVPVAGQTEDATNARLSEFLDKASAAAVAAAASTATV